MKSKIWKYVLLGKEAIYALFSILRAQSYLLLYTEMLMREKEREKQNCSISEGEKSSQGKDGASKA